MLSRMKPAAIIALVLGLAVGFKAGSLLERQRARGAILSGPYSDNFIPALSAITNAKAKVDGGDSNVLEQLQIAETQIRAAVTWSRRFFGDTNNGLVSKP